MDEKLYLSEVVLIDLRSQEAGHANAHHANYESALDVPRLLREVRRCWDRIEELEKDEAKLAALEAGGVDNWEGYEIAMEEHYNG